MSAVIDFPALLRLLKRPARRRGGGLRVVEVGPLHLRQLVALAHAREDVEQAALGREQVPPQTQGRLHRFPILEAVLFAVHFAYHILSLRPAALSREPSGLFAIY